MTRLTLTADPGRYQRIGRFYHPRVTAGTRISRNHHTAPGCRSKHNRRLESIARRLERLPVFRYKHSLLADTCAHPSWYGSSIGREMLVGSDEYPATLDAEILVGGAA